MKRDEDLEKYLVELLIEHGPLTDHGVHEVMDVPAWNYEQITFELRHSDNFIRDDSDRWHLTAEARQ